jgi:hypothetical protein
MDTARFTPPFPIGQFEVSVEVAAIGAFLTGREPTIRHHDTRAGHGRLVGKLATKLCHTDIGDCPCKVAIGHHAAHVQILDADGVEAFDQIRGQLMQGVIADIGDPSMKPCQIRLGL